MRGIFGLKTQKTGLSLAVTAIPKPVFSDFSVFFLVSALKARRLPDLSGRQIRQLLCDNSTKRNIEKGVCSKSAHGLELLSRIDRYFSLRESISATFLYERRFFTYLIRKFSLLKKALAPCMVVTTVTVSPLYDTWRKANLYWKSLLKRRAYRRLPECFS